MGLIPAISKPVGRGLTPTAQGTGGSMQTSQLAHGLQELHELLQAGKTSLHLHGHCFHFISTVQLPHYNGDTQTNPFQEFKEQHRLSRIRCVQIVNVAAFLIPFVCFPRCN